jgi:hypothetical protein
MTGEAPRQSIASQGTKRYNTSANSIIRGRAKDLLQGKHHLKTGIIFCFKIYAINPFNQASTNLNPL